jgi:hypothetical protein
MRNAYVLALGLVLLTGEAFAQIKTLPTQPTPPKPVPAPNQPSSTTKKEVETPPSSAEGILILYTPDDFKTTNWTKESHATPVFKSASLVGAVIRPEDLAASFQDFMSKVGTAFATANPPVIGPYTVEEIQLQLNLTAEGSFGIIASGKAGVQGGITVILKRTPPLSRP